MQPFTLSTAEHLIVCSLEVVCSGGAEVLWEEKPDVQQSKIGLGKFAEGFFSLTDSRLSNWARTSGLRRLTALALASRPTRGSETWTTEAGAVATASLWASTTAQAAMSDGKFGIFRNVRWCGVEQFLCTYFPVCCAQDPSRNVAVTTSSLRTRGIARTPSRGPGKVETAPARARYSPWWSTGTM